LAKVARRIAILSAAGSLAISAQAHAALVECPSVTVVRVRAASRPPPPAARKPAPRLRARAAHSRKHRRAPARDHTLAARRARPTAIASGHETLVHRQIACESVPLITPLPDQVIARAAPVTLDTLFGPPRSAAPLLAAAAPVPEAPLIYQRPGFGGPGTPRPPLTAVPEPATWAMMVLGVFGLGARLRRVRRAPLRRG
jgi:hypothetical protein